MNQPTRGLPACLDLLEQCLFGQMSIYFSWREEGARADQGRHCVQHAAPRSLCTSSFLNGAGDCDVSKKLPCYCSPRGVGHFMGSPRRGQKILRG